MSNVFVFTIDGCVHCRNLKKSLKQSNILFNELEVYENEELWEEIVEKTKEDVLPTIFIKQDDDGSGVLFIPGVDFFSEDEAIDLIKKTI